MESGIQVYVSCLWVFCNYAERSLVNNKEFIMSTRYSWKQTKFFREYLESSQNIWNEYHQDDHRKYQGRDLTEVYQSYHHMPYPYEE